MRIEKETEKRFKNDVASLLPVLSCAGLKIARVDFGHIRIYLEIYLAQWR